MKNIKISFVFSISMLISLFFIPCFLITLKGQRVPESKKLATTNSTGNLTVYESYTATKKNGDKVEVHFFDFLNHCNTGFCNEITSIVTLYNFNVNLKNDTIILVQSGTDKVLYRLTTKKDNHLISLNKMNPLDFKPDTSSAKVILKSEASQPIVKSATNISNQPSPANPQSIAEFETLITRGQKPIATSIYSKYDLEQRVIQWRESLIKNYMYSDEVFDKLGYNKLMWNTDEGGDGEIYRNCSKGIIVEVRNYEGELSITMTWYPKSIRNGIGYLMNCP